MTLTLVQQQRRRERLQSLGAMDLVAFGGASLLEQFIKKSVEDFPLRMRKQKIGPWKRMDDDGVGH
ncbi:MAG: hypothetical protein HYZ50_03790 [Deltaproteobacteria bacterium]|nr:hypothetical protein [Deltaproteobacteria bacterium]